MRVRITRKPPTACIDGIQLDKLEIGESYDISWQVGELMLVQGWGEPVTDNRPVKDADAVAQALSHLLQAEASNGATNGDQPARKKSRRRTKL